MGLLNRMKAGKMLTLYIIHYIIAEVSVMI